MQKLSTVALAVFVIVLAGCGGKYVDDKHNFERAFQAKCPEDVKVIHSIYVRTMHFTEEHEYYFQMQPSTNLNILKWLTGGAEMVESTNGLAQVPFYLHLRPDRPEWFASDALTNYKIWYNTKTAFVILSDKRKAEIFVYGSVGM